MRKNKALIIGLDSADPGLIETWIDQLPNFKKLFVEGCHGKLSSTIPPVTCPAWISFATGKNPGTLGAYDWQDFQPPHEPGLPNWKVPGHLKIWQMLGNAEYKVGVVNVPLTYPPEAVNGFMIGGFPVPPGAKDYAYPPQLVKQINSIVSGYDPDPKQIVNPDYLRRGAQQFLEEVDKATENVFSLAKHLIKTSEWHFFMVTFMCLDHVQHYFWRYLDKKHPDYKSKEAEEFSGAIFSFYKKIDNILGSLVSLTDENTYVLVMSDHGSGPQYGSLAINAWLMQKDLLTIKFESPLRNKLVSLLDFTFERSLNSALITKTLRKFGLFTWGRKLAHRTFGHVNPDNPLWTIRHLFKVIDWSQTKAIGLSNGKIYLNKEILSTKKQYERVREEVMSSLYELKDPLTGKKAVSQLFTKEQLYGKDYAGNPPDIIYFLSDLKYNQITSVNSSSLWQIPARRSGEHRFDGLFIAKGPGVKSGEKIDARIIDLAPTTLHLFGLPIPKDMDGRVLSEIFEPNSDSGRRPVVYKPAGEKARVKGKIRKLKDSGAI
jgi:predicted AlkP superfamily phosphohydrolase/phosphomutase